MTAKTGKKATRAAFGEAVFNLAEKYPNMVVLDADLSKSTKTGKFAEAFPDRYFDFGIAEANMISTAAGMALSGKVPFAASFGCFLTGRFDMIRISIGYARANVRLIGTHAGIATGPDGYSQMGNEDLALMRAIPEMAVFQPADDIETEQIIDYLAGTHQGPAYVRCTRHGLNRVHDENYTFEFEKIDILQEGKDLALVASGGPVENCLLAAQQLKDKGLEPTVVNVPTLKPIDKLALKKLAGTHQRIITVEDHTIIGGLGSAVLEALEVTPVKVNRLGIRDVFGESGETSELLAKHQLDVEGLVTQISKIMKLS